MSRRTRNSNPPDAPRGNLEPSHAHDCGPPKTRTLSPYAGEQDQLILRSALGDVFLLTADKETDKEIRWAFSGRSRRKLEPSDAQGRGPPKTRALLTPHAENSNPLTPAPAHRCGAPKTRTLSPLLQAALPCGGDRKNRTLVASQRNNRTLRRGRSLLSKNANPPLGEAGQNQLIEDRAIFGKTQIEC